MSYGKLQLGNLELNKSCNRKGDCLLLGRYKKAPVKYKGKNY